jgi:hypothetical protein
MLHFAADENLNYNIVRGLLRRKSDLNIIRIQDVGLSGKGDETVLEWAAKENRILLTHDVTTITKYAYERINDGLPMPGVFEIKMNSPLGDLIDDIILLADYSYENEWEGQIIYLPLND